MDKSGSCTPVALVIIRSFSISGSYGRAREKLKLSGFMDLERKALVKENLFAAKVGARADAEIGPPVFHKPANAAAIALAMKIDPPPNGPMISIFIVLSVQGGSFVA